MTQLSSGHHWFASIKDEWPWMPVEKSRAWLDRVWPPLIALMANCAHRIEELAQDNAQHQAEIDAAKAAGLPEPPAGRSPDKGFIAPWHLALALVQNTCTEVIKAKRPYVRPSEAEEAEKKARKEQEAKEKAERKNKKGGASASAAAAAAASSSSSSAFISSVKPMDSARRTALAIQSMTPYLPELISLTVRVLAAGTASKEPSPRHQSLGEAVALEFLKALLLLPAVREWLATPAAKSTVSSLQTASFVALLSLERPFQASEYQINSYLKDLATREAEVAAAAAGLPKKKRKTYNTWGVKWYDELVDPRIEPEDADGNNEVPVNFGVKLLFPLLSSAPASAGLSELIWDHCVRGMRRAPASFAKKAASLRPTADNELRACFRGMQALLDLNPAFLAVERGERTAELLSLIEPVLLLSAAQESTWLLTQRGAVRLLLRIASLLAASIKSTRTAGSVPSSAVEGHCSAIRRLVLRVLRAPPADVTRTAQCGVLTLLEQSTTGAYLVADAMLQKLESTADAAQHLLVSLLELIETTLFASPSDRAQRATLSHAEYGLVESAFAAIGAMAQAQLHPPSEEPNPLLVLKPAAPLRTMDSAPATVPPLGVRVAQMLIRACETSTPVGSWMVRGAYLSAICPHLAFLVSRADLLHLAPLLHTLLLDSMRLVLRDNAGEFEEPCLVLRKECFLAWSALVEALGEDLDPALEDLVNVLAEVMHFDYWGEKKTAEQVAEEAAEKEREEKKEAERQAAREARYAAEEAKEAAEAAAAAAGGAADEDEEMKDGDDEKDEDGEGDEDIDDDGDGDDGEGEEEEDEDEEAADDGPAAAAAGGAPGLDQPEDSSAPDTDYSSCGNGFELTDTAEEPSDLEEPWDGPEDKDYKATGSQHEADFMPLYTALLQYGPKRFLYFHDRRLSPMLYRFFKSSLKSGSEQVAPFMPQLLRALADRRKRQRAESSSSSSSAAAAGSSSSLLPLLPTWDAALVVHERGVFWRLCVFDRGSANLVCHLLREFVVLLDILGDGVFDVPAQPERPDDEDESEAEEEEDEWPPKKLTAKQEGAKAKKKAAKEARALAKKNRFEERLAAFAEASIHTASSSEPVQTRLLLRFLRSLIRVLEGRLGMQSDRYDRDFVGCAELEVRDHHPPPPLMTEADADDEGEDSDAADKPKGKPGQRALKTARKPNSRKKRKDSRGNESDNEAASPPPKVQPGPRLPFRFAPSSTVTLHMSAIASFTLPHSHTMGRCPGGDSCSINAWIEVRCVALQVLSALWRSARSRPFVEAALDGRDVDGARHGNGSLREVLDTMEATEAFAAAVKQFRKEACMDGAKKAPTSAAAASASKRR